MRRLIIGLCTLKKTLCLIVFLAVILVIVELSLVSFNEGEYTIIDSVQDQFVNFEGKLDDPKYFIVDDVPSKSPAYDENWMDGYSEGRLLLTLELVNALNTCLPLCSVKMKVFAACLLKLKLILI